MTLKRINIFSFIFTLTAIALLTSCHSSQQATATAGWEGTTSGSNVAKNAAYVTTQDDAWTTMSCPVKVAIKSPSSMSASGRAQLVRGKCIYISMRMLGFEVATLYIDNDTIVVADKFDKKCFTTSYATLRDNYNLSISTLQDILLGRKVNLPNFNGVNITMTQPSDNSQLISTLTIEPSDADNIYFTYGTPMTTDCIQMMSGVDITTKIKSKDVALSLTWETAKATFNTDINPTPTNVDGYSKLSLSAISSALKAK